MGMFMLVSASCQGHRRSWVSLGKGVISRRPTPPSTPWVTLGLCLGSQSFLRDLADLRMDAGWGTSGHLPPPLQAPQSSAFHAIPHLVRPSFPLTPDNPPRPTLPSRKTLSSPFLHPSAPFSFLPNMFHSASDRGAPFQMLSETCWEENTFQGCSLSLTISSN